MLLLWGAICLISPNAIRTKKTMTEEIKAVTEVAKTTGKITDAVREFGGWIAKITSGTVEQGMGIFEDKLKYMRFERQIVLMDKVNQKMSERGLDGSTRPIPLKITIPLLQAASMEEDDDLQELWANLLVNAADKNSRIEIRRSYINILEELTAFDVLILDKIYSEGIGDAKPIWTYKLPEEIATEDPKDKFGVLGPDTNVVLSLESLCRLNLLEPTGLMGFSTGPGVKCVMKTASGIYFYKACTTPAGVEETKLL